MSVSVVVRACDSESWVAEAVTSVVSQSLPPDELLLVDDASVDRTVQEALRASGSSEIRVIRHAERRGAAATFNAGVAAAKSSHVVVLDADDRLSPRYLEAMTVALDRTGASFGYAETRLFGAVAELWPARPFDARRLARENFVNVAAMFRSDVFADTGGHRGDLPAFEDWEFWLHAVELGHVGVPVPGCWLEYRRHASGSRNTLTRATAYRMHWRLHRLHNSVRWSDIGAQAVANLRRRIGPRVGGA